MATEAKQIGLLEKVRVNMSDALEILVTFTLGGIGFIAMMALLLHLVILAIGSFRKAFDWVLTW